MDHCASRSQGEGLRRGRAAYVTAVYEAEIISGVTATADGELSDVAWFSPSELGQLTLSRLSQALLQATGHISSRP